MQVLELAGRAFEDQVSKSGHAQVSATLWQKGGTPELSPPAVCPWDISLASLRSGPGQKDWVPHRVPCHQVWAVCPSDPRHRPLSPCRAPACITVLGTERDGLTVLTSSSQYLRITSRALSVISGASSTTLVKILPETKGEGLAVAEKLPNPAGAWSRQGCPSHIACSTPREQSFGGRWSQVQTLTAG